MRHEAAGVSFRGGLVFIVASPCVPCTCEVAGRDAAAFARVRVLVPGRGGSIRWETLVD